MKAVPKAVLRVEVTAVPKADLTAVSTEKGLVVAMVECSAEL